MQTTTQNLTDLERVQIALQGSRDFHQRCANLAAWALPHIPNHKQLTIRINQAIAAGVADKITYAEGYRFDDTPYKYAAESVEVRKDRYWSDKWELIITTDRRDIQPHDREARKTRDTVRYTVDSVEQLRAILEHAAESNAEYAAEADKELNNLEGLQATYDQIQAAKKAFNDKYSYTVRRFYEVGR